MECSNIQKRLERCTRWPNWPEESQESNSDEKTFNVDSVSNKQNVRVVTFGKSVSKTAECQQPGIQPAWRRSIERGEDAFGLIWTGLQGNLCRKFFYGSKRSLKNQITSSNKTKHQTTRQRLCTIGWTPTLAFGPKTFGFYSHQIWTPLTSACGGMDIGNIHWFAWLFGNALKYDAKCQKNIEIPELSLYLGIFSKNVQNCSL